ncbi:MAG: hypothetical protein JW827_08185 [Spirochaetes bacterium]|nr:hypothetical protein [Spirochaetota bacterium]
MYEENEVIMLFIGLGILIFVLANLRRIQKILHYRLLLTGFFCLLSGWVLTVMEGLLLNKLLNILEHIFYLASSVFLVIWARRVFQKKEP